MTLLFCDSYDHYTTPSQKYNEVTITGSGGTVSIGGSFGRFGSGMRINSPNGATGTARVDIPSTDVVIVGFAYRYTKAQAMELLRLQDAGTVHVNLAMDSSGRLYVARNGTPIGSVAANGLQLNVWHYIELKVLISDGSGTCAIRVNGVEVATNDLSADTRNGATAVVNQVVIYSSQTFSSAVDYDDFYVCDDNGSTNNDFLGDIRVQPIFPDGNGNSSQLVGSDGNSTDNYLLVDETDPNDADYVESSTVGEKDTYTYGSLTPTAGTVYGVQVMTRAAKTDAGARSVCSIARLSGTEVDSADKTLSTTYQYLRDIRETKPGGGAWSISDVNSAEFGVKVTA